MSDATLDEKMVCPVCRAAQAWSDTCRRCRCDLRLLRQADRARRAARQQVLLNLRAGRFSDALRAARDYHTLTPGDDSQRLLTVCCLLTGDFGEATEWANIR